MNYFESIKTAISKLDGTYGLAIVAKDEPKKIYGVRNGSPLLMGISDDAM